LALGSPRSTFTSWNVTLNLSVRDALALERDAAAVVSRPMVTAATAISGNWDTT
jgi:hypothetical protein